jgi:hypothetical protein
MPTKTKPASGLDPEELAGRILDAEAVPDGLLRRPANALGVPSRDGAANLIRQDPEAARIAASIIGPAVGAAGTSKGRVGEKNPKMDF